jgi:hypothetical protein
MTESQFVDQDGGGVDHTWHTMKRKKRLISPLVRSLAERNQVFEDERDRIRRKRWKHARLSPAFLRRASLPEVAAAVSG